MLCAAALLGGCGGGLYIGWGGDGDFPPNASLAASVSSASPGQTIHFTAAASDDFHVDAVSLIRIEADGRRTVLATDGEWPWTFDSALPAGASGTVSYFARAEDDVGQTGDSAILDITVR